MLFTSHELKPDPVCIELVYHRQTPGSSLTYRDTHSAHSSLPDDLPFSVDFLPLLSLYSTFLSSLKSTALPSRLYEASPEVEGGYTTQLIANYVYYKRYLKTVLSNTPCRIHVSGADCNITFLLAFLDQLSANQQSCTIPFSIYITSFLRLFTTLLRTILKSTYLTFSTILISLFGSLSTHQLSNCRSPDVLFVQASMASKHHSLLASLSNYLSQKSRSSIILLFSPFFLDLFRLPTHLPPVVNAFSFLPLAHLLKSVIYPLYSLPELFTRFFILLIPSEKTNRFLHLQFIISSLFFFVTELPERIRIYYTFKAVPLLRPKWVRPWCPESFLGRESVLNLPDASFFYFSAGIFARVDLVPLPYIGSSLHKFFPYSKQECENMSSTYQLQPQQLSIIPRLNSTAITPSKSFGSFSSILYKWSQKLTIGLDPGGNLLPFCSEDTQLALLLPLLILAKENSHVTLLIKPHPSWSISHLKPVINSFPCHNIKLLDKNANLHDFLSSLDLLISHFSTLLLDALSYDILTVSVDLPPLHTPYFSTMLPYISSPYQYSQFINSLALPADHTTTLSKFLHRMLMAKRDLAREGGDPSSIIYDTLFPYDHSFLAQKQ